MRSVLAALLSFALATTTLAAPEPVWGRPQGLGGWRHRRQSTPTCVNDTTSTSTTANVPGSDSTECPSFERACLTADQATAGSEIFRDLIQAYTDELALEALTEDFVDYSSAVNIIRNRGNDYPFVVNEATFTSREAFMAAQGAQPLIPFEILNVRYGCDFIVVRWQTLRSAQGQPNESDNIPVVGLGVLNIVFDSANSYGFRIQELWSEFNAAAWLVNNGVFTPSPVTTTMFPEETAAPAKRAPAPWERAKI